MKLALALIALAAPAAAQDTPATFSLPAGCEAFVTVQSESCQVDHHFICQGDPAGHKRRVSLDEQGMTYTGVTDDETQWISSFHVLSGHTEVLENDPAAPASLSELIATGADDFDFRTLSDEIGTTRYVGRDTLTGRQITIDDVTLDETTYDITAFDGAGNEIWSAQGREFISRDWRMFLAGTGTVTTSDGTFDRSNRPVEFIFPGEPGFLSASPKHGCGVAIS
ncbi:MAG: hypothetical protein ACSHXW_11030 [Yoonia sp.]